MVANKEDYTNRDLPFSEKIINIKDHQSHSSYKSRELMIDKNTPTWEYFLNYAACSEGIFNRDPRYSGHTPEFNTIPMLSS